MWLPRVLILAISMAFAAVADAGAQRTDSSARNPLSDSLKAFGHEMAALLRARNAEAVIRLYDDTLRFVHVDNGVIVPWMTLAPTMRKYLTTVKVNPVSVVGEPVVQIIDANTAIILLVHRMEATERGPAHDGTWTGVLRRTTGPWRIVHSHSSERK